MGWSPAGGIHGFPEVGVFPDGELRGNPVGCWLDMMYFGVQADQVKLDRRTR